MRVYSAPYPDSVPLRSCVCVKRVSFAFVHMGFVHLHFYPGPANRYQVGKGAIKCHPNDLLHTSCPAIDYLVVDVEFLVQDLLGVFV